MSRCTPSDRSKVAARHVVVGALTYLAAFSLRDIFTSVWEWLIHIEPTSADRKPDFGKVIGFKILFFVIVSFVAIFTAVYWVISSGNCDVVT